MTFQIYQTGSATTPVVVDYAVIDPHATGTLGAADFGGTLQFGSITLAVGQTVADITIDTPATLSLPLEELEVGISLVTTGVTLLNSTATAPVDTTLPVEGIDAQPAIYEVGNTGTLTQAGSVFTLALGTIGADGLAALTLGVANNANSAFADLLGGSFSDSGSGFTLSGVSSFSGVASGSADTAIRRRSAPRSARTARRWCSTRTRATPAVSPARWRRRRWC